jgi:hypothetical protein
MNSGSLGKKELFKAIKTAVPKGSQFKQAMKTASTFGIKKGATGKIVQSQAVKLMKELKNEHVLKTHVGEISTSGATAKNILRAAIEKKPEPVPEKKPFVSYKEQQAARLAEKEKILEEQNLRKASDVVHERTAKGYIVERQKEEERSGGIQTDKTSGSGRMAERGSVNLNTAPLSAPRREAPMKTVLPPPTNAKERAEPPAEDHKPEEAPSTPQPASPPVQAVDPYGD